MGLGAIPASDPQFLGMLGMHGTFEANMTMQHCDVLLAVGAPLRRPRDRQPEALRPVERKIIHIDIDPSSISKRVRVDIPIVGDVKDVLQELIVQVRDAQSRPDAAALAAWWSQINEWRKRECLKLPNRAQRSSNRSRGRDAVPADARHRRLHHLRRRPAPDVGRAVLQVRRTATLDQLRRPGHDGLRACPMRWAIKLASRNPMCSASPARARSRCASRSSRPACSTRRR